MSGIDSIRNPICSSGIATMSWTLGDEIAMHRRAGAEQIGLLSWKVASVEASVLADLLTLQGMRLAYLVHPLTARPDDEAAWAQQISALVECVRTAHAVGGDLVYVTSGPSRHLEWQHAAELFVQRLAPVVALAGQLGVRLAIENTLPVKCDISFTHTARDTIDLADRLGIGICLDLYCAWQERDLRELITTRIDKVEVLQVADFKVGTSTFPNRWVPGDADLPLAQMLETALAAGYAGPVDVELLGPAIDMEGTELAVTRAVAWTRREILAWHNR